MSKLVGKSEESALSSPTISVWDYGKNSFNDDQFIVKNMIVRVEVNVSYAFVSIDATYKSKTDQILTRTDLLSNNDIVVDGVFRFPTSHGEALVTSCNISFSDRRFVTSVVDGDQPLPDEDRELSKNCSNASIYDPEEFSMPFHSCPADSDVTISITYIQEMRFSADGKYEISVPLNFTPGSIVEGQSSEEVISITAVLYPGVMNAESPCEFGSQTHKLIKTNTFGTNFIQLELLNGFNNISDFQLWYRVSTSTISARAMAVCPPRPKLRRGTRASKIDNSINSQGSFLVFINPPASSSVTGTLPRSIVILLDRSGSMSGSPLTDAKDAVVTALFSLTPADTFTICAFDHECEWFVMEQDHSSLSADDNHRQPKLYAANPSNLRNATGWLQHIGARGGTDILTPYRAANNCLSAPLPNTVPIILLLTDGAVSNEREICAFAEETMRATRLRGGQTTRTHTFGIGPYCNRYFLRQLATTGRGQTDSAWSTKTLCPRMQAFMIRTRDPILVDVVVTVRGSGAAVITYYPQVVPDLSAGSPIVLAGRFLDFIPTSVEIVGRTSGTNGNRSQHFKIVTSLSAPPEGMPLSTLVTRLQLDGLVSQWWRETDMQKRKQLKEKVVFLSTQSSIPCPLTRSIAFEAPRVTSSSAPSNQNMSNTQTGTASKQLAGIVLGTTLFGVAAFGSVAATNGNLSVLSAMDIFGAPQLDFGSGLSLDGLPSNPDFCSICCFVDCSSCTSVDCQSPLDCACCSSIDCTCCCALCSSGQDCLCQAFVGAMATASDTIPCLCECFCAMLTAVLS